MEETVGARLRRLRHARGLSQESLAARAGISRYHLGRVERGELTPKTDVAARLERALDVQEGSLAYPERGPIFPEGVVDLRPVTQYCSPEGRKSMGKLFDQLARLMQQSLP